MGATIDGKRIAAEYKERLRLLVEERVEKRLSPLCIASILIGDDKGSIFYMNNQSKICTEIGVEYKKIIIDKNTPQDEILEVIDRLNNDSNTHGIIIQLPLPDNLDEEVIVNRISYLKDVDGLTDINAGKFYKGEKCFVPCTSQGIMELIKSTGIDISGKRAVVLGRSIIVGKSIAQLLLNEDATVTICHSKTVNVKDICKEADILISAIGRPKFVKEDFIKDGAVVIDVGFNVVNGKMVGDVDYENAINKASHITPVPGGVGSMTPIMLIKNTCEGLEDEY
ncbi:bifunctional methylenetetrahydrofolate dehydrogenase/methenyltetrahydrofolate cyclohydrolase [Clostridium sp. MSJ-11]|uniref:Bifunctional protein FolD n=1 Tax=Clostridium mobile TaxID=2841512 RepID=A0ABS6ECM6_9CLOT|nr:tetrahydrofolate dehydrogenase/cyclohydrolase catalytic domain-containing protein [Clostridium mobile]MBU5482940.1 bifunctional methylenetetrahydrofolate dehydrogenase/methenyltetrahydrofolate cyclohydrolase [Clostridium mobile]